MAPQVVVKIDLCKSKLFSREREAEDPEIRKVLAEKLEEIALEQFPYSEKKYPEGSFYKAEGDAVYFILEKPTVAIRSAIEFMKEWFYRGIKQSFPEAKIIIHRGRIDSISVPEGKDFVGKVFEDISVVEKTLDEGNIYVTEHVRKNADLTISKFVNYGRRKVSANETVTIFCVAFCDPRTFENDALAHLLFIAHKESAETRNKIFRFFLVEYLIENGQLSELDKFEDWSRSKGYSYLPRNEIKQLLSDKTLFELECIGNISTYRLREERILEIKREQEKYKVAVEQAVKTVCDEIIKDTGTEKAIDGFDIKKIMDEYLCGLFSEIRMMANYFRDTFHFYESDLKTFERYDYIIDRNLVNLDETVANKWKKAFIRGLKKVSEQESIYISAIFHNILAGYYMNRSFHSSPYQLEKLQNRRIFLDTNVLYSIRCESSSYHERVQYFVERLKAINVHLKVYPFTLEEFETSLRRVEIEYKKDPYSPFWITWNPWLYQEFKSRPYKYLNDIGVCRITYSVAKDRPILKENYTALEEESGKINIAIESNYLKFTKEEKMAIWDELRSIILSKTGDMEDYWATHERLNAYHENIIEHDVNLLENVKQIYLQNGDDELGPKVLLLTTDSKLIRCRKEYPFVISTEQFLEFMMPYLFLADVPEEDPNRFPNQILSAQLGVHTSYWKPTSNEVISMAIKHPEVLANGGWREPDVSLISKTLNQARFKKVIQDSVSLAEPEKEKVVIQLAEVVGELVKKDTENALLKMQLGNLKKKLEQETNEKKEYIAKSDKLRRTLKYYKGLKTSRLR